MPASASRQIRRRRAIGFRIESSTGLGIPARASDVVLRPRPETAFLDPFAERPTLVLRCGHLAQFKLRDAASVFRVLNHEYVLMFIRSGNNPLTVNDEASAYIYVEQTLLAYSHTDWPD